MGFVNDTEVKNYTSRVDSLSESKLAAYIEDASDWVRSIAPEPAESDSVYLSRAKRATLRVVEYFAEVGNLKSKGSVAGETASKTFADPDQIEKLIRPVMGTYAGGGSGAAVGYVGSFPFARG